MASQSSLFPDIYDAESATGPKTVEGPRTVEVCVQVGLIPVCVQRFAVVELAAVALRNQFVDAVWANVSRERFPLFYYFPPSGHTAARIIMYSTTFSSTPEQHTYGAWTPR